MLRVIVVVLLAFIIVATQGGFQTGGGRQPDSFNNCNTRKFRRWWLGKGTTSAKPYYPRQFAAATSTLLWSQKSTSSTCTIHSGRSRGPLLVELQQCLTPNELLHRVGRHVSHANDPDGSLASQVLVRLSKLCIAQDNHQHHHHPSTSSSLSQQQQQHEVTPLTGGDLLGNADAAKVLAALTEHLASRPIIILAENSDCRSNLEVLVDGTKACAIVARLTSSLTTSSDLLPSCCWWEPVTRMWQQHNDDILPKVWQEHQISGLHWALESLQVVSANSCPVPASIQRAYDELNLPFHIYPGLLLQPQQEGLLPVDDWITQVEHWGADEIRVDTTRVVPERRHTAWQGDDGVAPFAYSGKHMIRRPWSRPVRQVRDRLFATTSQYYNACLLNWYPDGQSGMRYHSDPDQGTLWDYDTVVVSVGATRRFAFRPNRSNNNVAAAAAAASPTPSPPHNFVVLHGDATHMWGDCQERFQHAVKNADEKQETAPRVSLVFKRSWGWCESSQSSSDESNNV